MAAQTAVPIFADSPEFFRQDDGTFVMTDSGGNAVVVDESWEETYPTGTFAFNTTQVNLTENGEGGSLNLYRLGGSDGRAIAKVTLVPATSYIDDDRMSYAYAAGRDDYLVEVENPHPSALTDPLGGTPVIYESGTDVSIRPITAAELAERGLDEDIEFCYQLTDAPDAYDFQWQIRVGDNGQWTDIQGADGEDLPASEEIADGLLFTEYDVRCLYTVDDVRYCSVSNWGESYVQPEVYEMDGWDELAEYYASLDDGEEFSPIIFEGGEYDNYSFYVVFAEGEDEKEIRFTALDDDKHEAREVVNILIEEAYGATLYNTANVATAAIEDDEPELPSAMGFESDEIWADMSYGSIRIPLIRTVEDPAALVYITGVDYTVEEGTAVPGRNYAAVDDGTILFPADMDASALEITLVNNGEILTREDSDLSFTVRLTAAKGGGSSTLIDGKDEITVRLFNSGEGNASNIASRIYSDAEVDVTMKVDESSAIVSHAPTLVAEAVDLSGEAVAEYTPVVDGAMSRVIDYGKLSFDNVLGNSKYWKDYYMPYNMYGTFTDGNFDTYGTITWSGGEAYGSGWQLFCKKGGTAFGTIPHLYRLYSDMTFKMSGTADKNMSDYSKLGFSYASNGTQYSLREPNKTLSSVGHYGEATAKLDREIQPADTGIGLICSYHNTALIRYNADSTITLEALRLKRRYMDMPSVKIFTADDDLIYKNSAIVNRNLYDQIKPQISIPEGKGGLHTSASIYAGSTLNIRRGLNASSYDFATIANGGMDKSVLLHNNNRNEDIAAAAFSSGTAVLEMLFDPHYLEEDNEIRIYMDRTQTITLDISPSVPRKIDAEGNISTEIDSSRISEAWNDLKTKNGSVLRYSYKELDENHNFVTEDGSFELDDPFDANFSKYISAKVKNLQTINFGLDPEDVILFNGMAYAGDETITIPANMLLNENLTFYYYDDEYLNMENIMTATITRIERYIDINENGIVDGEYDESSGTFQLEPETDMVLESLSIDLESISISSLAPHLLTKEELNEQTGTDKYTSDEYLPIILKVYYTMLPRCITVPEGHSAEETAEIIPAFVTSITDPAAKSKLTAELQGYRYIDPQDTGKDKLMFGAAAANPSYVDIPLGGDTNPAAVESDGTVNWVPLWEGHSYPGTEFTAPEPITLNGTALGDGYAVGEFEEKTITETDENGTETTYETMVLTEYGVERVANYLSSMQENDRFALCIRETPEQLTRGADAPVHYLEGIESSTLSNFYTYPSTTGVRTMTDPYGDNTEAGFDMEEGSNPMSEYNMNGNLNMPEFDIGLSDYVSITTNGQEMAISIGTSLIGFEAKSDHGQLKPKSPEMNSVVSEGQDGIDKVKKLYNTLFTHGTNRRDGIGKDVKDEWKNIKDAARTQATGNNTPGLKSLGFSGGVAVNISMVLKWNPLENRFFFYQMMVMFAGELQFSFTARLTPCPIFYVSITVGIGVELATGLERQRVKVKGETINILEPGETENGKNGITFGQYDTSGDMSSSNTGWTYYTDQKYMGQDALDPPENADFVAGAVGSQMKFKTSEKAFDIYFSGALYVDAKRVDKDGNETEDRPEGFSPGIIKSTGDEPVTVKLAKVVDGNDNEDDYAVTFTVVKDEKQKERYVLDAVSGTSHPLPRGMALIDNITTIDKQTDDVYFAGFQLAPSLFMEVAVGIGVELFKIELFINISVGATFAFITHDSPEYEQDGSTTMGAAVNEFSFVAGVGLRVTALFFNFEFSAVQFAVTYDREARYDEDLGARNGWNFTWYAANQPVKHYRSGEAEETDPIKVRLVLPSALAGQEKLFTPDENAGISFSRAFNPTDTEVPFQYSGYGTSGDAFTLGKDLLPGSTYELVTVGDANYIVYTVSRPNTSGTLSDIDTTMLVLSKVQETVTYEDVVSEEGFEDNPENYIESATMGLVHPVASMNGINAPKYLVLDNDDTGDLDFSVWADGNDIRVAWVSYTDEASEAYSNVLEEDGDAVEALRAASGNTVVKTITFDTLLANQPAQEDADTGTVLHYTPDSAVQVSPADGNPHGIYTSPSGAGDMIFYSEAVPYEDTELEELLGEYEEYLGYDTAMQSAETTVEGETLYYGSTDPTVDFQLQQKRMQAAVYGKSFYPTFAYKNADGTYTNAQVVAEDWVENGVNLENAALTEIDGDYYAAYTTAQYGFIENGTEEEVVRKLYLQKVTVTAEDTSVDPTVPAVTTTITPDSAIALRMLVDNRDNNDADGVYIGGARTKYEDPYFANVKFLTGKLGELDSSDPESFDEVVTVDLRRRDAAQPEEFLIFEMNGNTYIVPKADILSITTDHSGSIIPFFTRRLPTEDEEVQVNGEGDIVATNVTFGTDPQGNISAVYTAAVENTSNTALYLTKYDSDSQTWGAGTMLAMHHMQVYEDSVSNGWDTEETKAAYFTPQTSNDPNVTNTDIYNFTFGKLTIGLGHDDKLLVLAEGSKMLLEEQQQYRPEYTYDNDGSVINTELVRDGDTRTFVPKTNETTMGYDVSNGMYALTFGAGNAALGYASLNLSNYDFTPASEMYASVSFTNLGDTAIRAGESNPVTIELLLEDHSTPLQTWTVSDTIRAGQSVTTTSEYVRLPAAFDYGKKLYFRVYEDKTYIETNFSGTAFDLTTLTEAGEPDTAACITLEERIELGYESTKDGLAPIITIVGADDKNVTLQADIFVGNRGALDSAQTYLKFEYDTVTQESDGSEELVIAPINLTDHKLTVSEQQELSRTVTEKTLANGYLLLATTENGEIVGDGTGEMKSMHGRTVKGTFTVPKSCFDTDYGTHSLNLRLTLEGYDEAGNLLDEYDVSNNIRLVSVEQKTFFETANNLNIQVGSYLRIPLTMTTSRMEKPSITVREITDDNNERNLSMLYYDAVQEAIIIVPSDIGEGKIRVEDHETNSVYDICYTVAGEGVEINIYDDNGIFTWLDQNGNAGDAGHDAWRFYSSSMLWSDTIRTPPMRNDLSVADAGESFTFRTLADSITLYFMGENNNSATISVSSSLESYEDVILDGENVFTSSDGTKGITIPFNNPEGQAHTVRITAVSDLVRFDKMIENFTEDFEVRTDPAAPELYFTRTLPEMASIEDTDDAEEIIGVYFVDMGGLASVVIDGVDVTDQLTKVNDSNELWYYELTATENTGHSFVINDQSGYYTARNLSIDWFSTDVAPENADPGAEEITVTVVDKEGNPVTGAMSSGEDYFIRVTGKDGSPIEGAVVSYIPFGNENEVHHFLPFDKTDEDGRRKLGESAVYRVDYTPEGSPVTSTRMICIDRGSTSFPAPSLGYDPETKLLTYSVMVRDSSTPGKLTISSTIVSVTLNGEELLPAGSELMYFEGTKPYEASGTYTLTAENENGNTSDITITIPDMPIEFSGEVLDLTMATENDEDGTVHNDGKIEINESNIIGGERDGDSSRADYEYALVPDGETPEDDDWTDETVFGELPVGEYDLYIRDKNNPDDDGITKKVDVTIGYANVRINSYHSTPTDRNTPTGSISVKAEGGYSELEYSYVPDGAVIDDNGTPDDDSDDTVSYEGVTYPLWTHESDMHGLPEGVYKVTVRETEPTKNDPLTLDIVYVSVPFVLTIHEIRTVPVQKDQNNGQISVLADGGYGDLEYSYVPDGAVIDDNGTPDDDRDDTVSYEGAEYPLWMDDSAITILPVGSYTVKVRDERGSIAELSAVEVPDHMVIRVNTVPTYENESTGSITVLALGGYGEFEYCYIPLNDDGSLRDDVVIGTAEYEGESYQTITFDGRAPAPLWTSEYELTDIPKGRYMIIVRDTADSTYKEEYPDVDDLLKMEENRCTAIAEAEIRNHDKFEITVAGDIGAIVSPEGVTLVQRHRGLTVYFEPEPGFQLVEVLIDGKSVNVYGSYTFENVNEPHTISVITRQLETIPKRLITLEVSSSEGGAVSNEGKLIAAYGSSRTFRIKADDGWRIADVLVDGESVGAVSSYEFRAIIEPHTLHAVFEKIEEDDNP